MSNIELKELEPLNNEKSLPDSIQADLNSAKKIFKATFESLSAQLKENKINASSTNLRNFLPKPFEKPEAILPSLPKKSEFSLRLSDSIDFPILKSRYFNLKVELVQKGNFELPINETVNLEVMVFDQNKQMITRNVTGKEILRGNAITPLRFSIENMKHIGYFRIQITEVSSHYEGKVLNIKIKARKSEFLKTNEWKIKSLYLKNITVKSKNLTKQSN